MLLNTEHCPFCDKIFYRSSLENRKKDLLIHIKEHHHIDEKHCRAISAAVLEYDKLNDLCKEVIKSYAKFVDDVAELQKENIRNVQTRI